MNNKIYVNVAPRCPGEAYEIKQGDTLYSIAQKYNTKVRDLLFLNPFVDIYNLQIGDKICVPKQTKPQNQGYIPYVVKKGDTLGSILDKTKYTYEQLLAKNPMLAKLELKEGSILLLPPKKERDWLGGM